MRPIPGLDASYDVIGWSPDGESVYAASNRADQQTSKVYQVNVATGKIQLWKTFGAEAGAGANVNAPLLSSNGSAYAYIYVPQLSEAYVVTGLK